MHTCGKGEAEEAGEAAQKEDEEEEEEVAEDSPPLIGSRSIERLGECFCFASLPPSGNEACVGWNGWAVVGCTGCVGCRG